MSIILPSLFCGLALSYLLPVPSADVSRHLTFPSRSTISWFLRILLAILAFPLCYFIFGLMVGPFVVDFNRIGHSLEIGADSFAHAAALVFLLVPRHSESAVSTPAQVAPMFPS
jgi:hypothetical protein